MNQETFQQSYMERASNVPWRERCSLWEHKYSEHEVEGIVVGGCRGGMPKRRRVRAGIQAAVREALAVGPYKYSVSWKA